ncbi:Dihydrolipoyllysine-residue succinyltransferase component of 2-oxoglutarate dehydrogenase complex [Edwardsiella tarda]|nr:Dihydrolipoyllysine-residue succinyltransferase component of 2-oxoglutarate dehydrogenase complex [Edwardsiella tarda]
MPMTRLRKRVAERLLEAKNSTAMLTTFNEVNMQPIMDLRSQYGEAFEKRHGVRLGFMSFYVKAVLEALKRYPEVNAALDGEEVVYHNYFDISIAVSTPRGLVTPVIRDVDTLSMAEIEKRIKTLAVKGRDGKLTVEELTGGNFTITNGGGLRFVDVDADHQPTAKCHPGHACHQGSPDGGQWSGGDPADDVPGAFL